MCEVLPNLTEAFAKVHTKTEIRFYGREIAQDIIVHLHIP